MKTAYAARFSRLDIAFCSQNLQGGIVLRLPENPLRRQFAGREGAT